MAKESQLWTLVKENLPKDAHVQRIETGLTGKGVPDLNYCQYCWLFDKRSILKINL